MGPLFRSFRMTEKQLKHIPIQDGYFYLTTDNDNSIIGRVYIDWGNVRYSINSKYAQGLISEDGETIITVDDLYKLLQNANGTKEYQVTIEPSDWKNNQYTWEEESLTCGPAGITPPQITCMENSQEYLYLIDADAIPGVGITFSAYKEPARTIKLLIIDTIGNNRDFLLPNGDISNSSEHIVQNK